jgi:hypothetical protein
MLTHPFVLGLFWLLGMYAYAVANYQSTVGKQPGAPALWKWLLTMNVLSIKIIGIAVAGVWIHQWPEAGLHALNNLLPHRPFAAFVLGFFCDSMATYARGLVGKKLGSTGVNV